MKLSIRYDMAFQSALLRFADDQTEASTNPSLQQEQETSLSFMGLCDTIDRYCERRVEVLRDSLAEQLKQSS